MLRQSFAAAIGIISFGITSVATAAPIGYWQFDEGTGTTAASTVNGLDGTLGTNGSGAVLPSWSTQTAGGRIIDGIGGSVVNANNSYALFFDNTGSTNATTGNLNSNTGSLVRVTDDPETPQIQPAAFTVEAFVKISTLVEWPLIVGKAKTGADTTWNLDLDNGGRVRSRFDTDTNHNQSPSTGISINDGEWHHVALSYDGQTARLYVDYVEYKAQVVQGSLEYTSGDLFIGNMAGGRAFDGWIDEVRLSDGVLNSDQFLRAVPEPASMALLALGGIAFVRRR